MGNRKKPPRQRRQRPAVHPSQLPGFGGSVGGTFGSAGGSFAGFNQMARSACPQCGAPVAWVDAEAAKAHGLDVDQVLVFHGASSPDEVEFWTCTACSEAGAMGAPTSSF